MVGCYKCSCFFKLWVGGGRLDGWYGVLVGVVWVDRIVGEDVLYAHEVWNRGVKWL